MRQRLRARTSQRNNSGTLLYKFSPIRIAVIESDPLRFIGFRALFDPEPELELYPATAVEITTRSDIDLILLGSRGSQNLFDLMAGLKATRPDLRILVTGIGAGDETMLKALIAGAKGYVDEAATPPSPPPRESPFAPQSSGQRFWLRCSSLRFKHCFVRVLWHN